MLPVLSGPEAGAQTDSLYLDLDSTTFVSQKVTSSIRRSGDAVLRVDLDMIQGLPQMMGNTDPISFIRTLPGVQTGSEYDSGIHIQGSDNSHNEISLGGVPVFGASHLFGLFSVFNPAHHEKMSFSRSAPETNRLGGSVIMEMPDTLKRKASGEITAGIMSSQGSIGVRLGKHSHLKVSARSSYMNLLYKRWLQIEHSPVRYGFGDYNLTYMYASGKDRVWADFYFGQDHAIITEISLDVGLEARWGNHTGALHWEHKGDNIRHRHTIYESGFRSDGSVRQDVSALQLASSINALGYRNETHWKDLSARGDITFYSIVPQTPLIGGSFGTENDTYENLTSLETSFGAEYRKKLPYDLEVSGGIKGTYYLSPEREDMFNLSPRVQISYNGYDYGKVTAACGLQHQYLFQTGLSNIGLPIEFWLPAGRYSAPQQSAYADLSYEVEFLQDSFSLRADLYYKKLGNQVDYSGDIMDFFSSVYDLDSHLLKGDGWNYGLNLMLHKQAGRLTGWVSYSVGRALRRFMVNGHTGLYPANHERIHELNAVCCYAIGSWDLSGTFVYASGAPFTAPESYYLSAGQILTVFGEHNACRMRPYMRLDLSATHTFNKGDERENSINLSVHNALGRDNDVMYRLYVKDGEYSYDSMSFFLRFVPSVSYRHKF